MKILIALISIFTLVLIGGAAAFFSLHSKISSRLEKGWVIPPLELYSQGFALSPGRHFPLQAIQEELQHRSLQSERDYILAAADACSRLTGVSLKDSSQQCLWIKKTERGPLLVGWDEKGFVQEIWGGEPWAQLTSFALFPRLITQFFDGQPILQQNTSLSEVPLACLQGVTAIEDREFLEHGGVSATGILRALVRNLRAGRWAEGGSTITQQLVKNFFLTAKKTIRRKVEEQFLAVMLESQLSKDQILEMYLNVIYMGQSGPYQVRGFGSAAQYYFDKRITDLNLPECALLAALINNPGRYSPFTHAPQATARRELVLHKMLDGQMISDTEFTAAKSASLPPLPQSDRRTHAPYFVMSALKEFTALGLDAEEGARLYTTLDPEAQAMTMVSVQNQMPKIEARIKKKSKEPLQVSTVTVDLNTAEVIALVGGRDFRATQFNRAVDSRRQIGSIVKPFVYWPAMKTRDPLTPVNDEPFEWKTGKQVWRPKNYEGKSVGMLPYFVALAQSLNIPAAHVGQDVGLDAVAETLKAAGISENIPNLPSLTLGALELSPMEVAQMYLSLARLAPGDHVHTLARVENPSGGVLYDHQPAKDFNLDPTNSAIVVGMMEQSLTVGTARSARALGIEGVFAGKTGTTSDTKDAWFVGFSPRLLTVVWVGYDDNTVMGLTGAGAALPVWIDLMKPMQKLFAPEDFHWPDTVKTRSVSRGELRDKFPALEGEMPDEIQLIFAR
ncbi:MAG: transglycosylase domain-containing protein [Bdellovibrionales bacterium]